VVFALSLVPRVKPHFAVKDKTTGESLLWWVRSYFFFLALFSFVAFAVTAPKDEHTAAAPAAMPSVAVAATDEQLRTARQVFCQSASTEAGNLLSDAFRPDTDAADAVVIQGRVVVAAIAGTESRLGVSYEQAIKVQDQMLRQNPALGHAQSLLQILQACREYAGAAEVAPKSGSQPATASSAAEGGTDEVASAPSTAEERALAMNDLCKSVDSELRDAIAQGHADDSTLAQSKVVIGGAEIYHDEEGVSVSRALKVMGDALNDVPQRYGGSLVD